MTEFLPANHILFQLANTCLLLSLLAFKVLQLRIALAMANFLFMMWAAEVLDFSLDTFLWNLAFCIVNSAQAMYLIYQMRPVIFDCAEHEILYQKVLSKAGVGRREAKILFKASLLRTLKAGTVYVSAGNLAHDLALIESGKMAIKRNEATLAGNVREVFIDNINPFEFVESPEWCSSMNSVLASLGDEDDAEPERPPTLKARFLSIYYTLFWWRRPPPLRKSLSLFDPTRRDPHAFRPAVLRVTVEAVVDTVFVTWPMERLYNLRKKNPSLISQINVLIGADVSRRLLRQSDRQHAIKQKAAATEHDEEGSAVDVSASAESLTTTHNGELQGFDPWSGADVCEIHEEAVVIRTRLLALFAHGKSQRRRAQGFCGAPRYLLSSAEATSLAKVGRIRRIRREGTIMLRQGEECSSLILLLEGNVRVYREVESGTLPHNLYSMGPGDFIGASILIPESRTDCQPTGPLSSAETDRPAAAHSPLLSHDPFNRSHHNNHLSHNDEHPSDDHRLDTLAPDTAVERGTQGTSLEVDEKHVQAGTATGAVEREHGGPMLSTSPPPIESAEDDLISAEVNGWFVSEVTYENAVPGTVVAEWDIRTLAILTKQNPHLQMAVMSLISADLVRKFRNLEVKL
eukprot:Rmarinus@m.25813